MNKAEKKQREKTRRIKPGELQSVLASEEVIRRNVNMIIEYSQETRKMVHELLVMFDALQKNVMNMKSELDEQKRQLAILQQISCSKGTKNYGDQR